jgi:hypothetical protein
MHIDGIKAADVEIDPPVTAALEHQCYAIQ